MKKVLAVALVLMLVLSLAGCGSSQPTAAEAKGKYQDGIYFAQEDAYAKGWKYVTTIEVKDGKIATVDWNAVNANGGATKKALSASGKYGMKAKGNAQAEWHEQAAKAEAFLVETQDVTKISVNAEGKTDDVAGVSIGVDVFVKLVEKALAAGPVGKGKYADGAYYAEAEAFAKGWKYTASLTVVNGNIVAADWDGVNLAGGKDKDTLSADGEYGMKAKGNAQAEWHEQAEKAEAYLLKTQDPAKITYKSDAGDTDDIAGASIKVKEFFTLAQKALDNGAIAEGPYKDGYYHAQAKEFAKGFKYMAHIAVKNGTIVAVDWNAIPEKAGDPDKDALSKSGAYGMKEKGKAVAEWHEQAALTEAYILKNQDPAKITLKNAEGNTDDIAGVTIKVGEFFALAQEALKAAK